MSFALEQSSQNTLFLAALYAIQGNVFFQFSRYVREFCLPASLLLQLMSLLDVEDDCSFEEIAAMQLIVVDWHVSTEVFVLIKNLSICKRNAKTN